MMRSFVATTLPVRPRLTHGTDKGRRLPWASPLRSGRRASSKASPRRGVPLAPKLTRPPAGQAGGGFAQKVGPPRKYLGPKNRS